MLLTYVEIGAKIWIVVDAKFDKKYQKKSSKNFLKKVWKSYWQELNLMLKYSTVVNEKVKQQKFFESLKNQ